MNEFSLTMSKKLLTYVGVPRRRHLSGGPRTATIQYLLAAEARGAAAAPAEMLAEC